MDPKETVQEIVVDAPTVVGAIASAPEIDQLTLKRSAHRFLATVLHQPSLPGSGPIVATGPTHQLQFSELLDRIFATSESLLSALALIQALP